MSHTVTFVGFKGEKVSEIQQETPIVYSIPIEEIPKIIENTCTYHGTTTDLQDDTFISFMENVEKLVEMDMDEMFRNYPIVCMIVDDVVLFLDMLRNLDNFMAHPLYGIGNAYLVRERIEKLFPEKTLKFLTQSMEWYKKQEAYCAELEERKKELLKFTKNY